MAGRAIASIVGLGREGLVRTATAPAMELARCAVEAAVADAGLSPDGIDGLIVCRTSAATDAVLGLDLAHALGLRDLALLQLVLCEGASSIAAIQAAAMAVRLGLAKTIACVFADAPLVPGKPVRASFGRIKTASGIEGLWYSAGLFGGGAVYALAARRYLAHYGVADEMLGHVAISARCWAALNPDAVFREPLTMADYLAARYIAEPFRLYDCAIPVNGAVAVVVTSPDRAANLQRPPVHIVGMGQGHPGLSDQAGEERELTIGATRAAATMLAMADIGIDAIDLCEAYDAFSIMTWLTLEQYGFCGAGEAPAFVADGAIAPGGRLPVNTGGGHLSGYYLQGMTPVAEAVIQARGAAGERQCSRADTILVTNSGGRFDYHAGLILGRAGAWS